MKHYQQTVVTCEHMRDVASDLIACMGEKRIVTLTGPLGAGKTTLVSLILRQLGVIDPIQSPTYTYVSVYTLPSGKKVYHFDLYRLHTLDDFIHAGFDEYLHDTDAYCFIEWPSIIESIVNHNEVCSVILDYGDNDTRKVTLI